MTPLGPKIRHVLGYPFRKIVRTLRAAGASVGRKVTSWTSGFIWKRRWTALVAETVAQMKKERKQEKEERQGCAAVAPFVTNPHALPTSLGALSAEMLDALTGLFPPQQPVEMKSKVTGSSITVRFLETVGVSSYGSVLIRCQSSAEAEECSLEAFPVTNPSLRSSATVRRQYLRAMKQLKTASGPSQVGIPRDLLVLKSARGSWCPQRPRDAFAFPNVFFKRSLQAEKLREVLTHMAAATDPGGQRTAHDARVSLTKQVHKGVSLASPTLCRHGNINIDSIFVTVDGIVHLQPPVAECPSPEQSSVAADRHESTAEAAAEETDQDREILAPAEEPISDDLALAIVFTHIWCPLRNFEDVAYELTLLNRFEREVPEEFFERCASPPDAIEVLIAMLAL
ncbi:putative RNA helicase-1 [Neospora caninum Liverpool]|uniref:Putative RNA helicase-1 n=1 Tax=Neospora caninum (strain Liverpool) TaxID=572307 RepID=F0VCH5_NEOCL|nr:putative RNA helicase-1 [Neospora caninum Liverpool]CBZ51297.1 putative RNA helicase-1 [Neospora caninum Liverpool]CEL68611.1 TPA: RNA helicase-1, putative [Neospora caninum Liverpool]|eukprot:XP_003881330.1 putative RNA helicase-1 [Neospora caninum Liverpool]